MSEKKNPKHARTTQGLRDILFDEIDELRTPDANPDKSMAVANIAKQIINTAKVELEFTRIMQDRAEETGEVVKLGNLRLGTD